MSIHTDIALPQTLSDVLRARDETVRYIREAFACHERAEAAASVLLRYAMPAECRPRYSLEQAIKEIDQRMWRCSFRLAGFDDMWDAKAAQDFEKSIARDTPEFTDANLRATFIELLPQRGEMFNRGLVRLFQDLSGNYKSNNAFKIGQRMVAGYWTVPAYRGGREINYHRQNTVRDLLRVLYKLTERPFDPGKALGAVNTAWQIGEYRDPYLRMVPFKNGNVHIYIIDEPLRNRINNIISEYYGGRALAEAA